MTPAQQMLNKTLEELLMLEAKIREAHWNGRGRGFLPLHRELDDFYHDVAGFIDDVAERVRALNGLATFDVHLVNHDMRTPEEICVYLANHADNISSHIEGRGYEFEKGGDSPTQDFLNEIVLKLDEWAWLLRSNQ